MFAKYKKAIRELEEKAGKKQAARSENNTSKTVRKAVSKPIRGDKVKVKKRYVRDDDENNARTLEDRRKYTRNKITDEQLKNNVEKEWHDDAMMDELMIALQDQMNKQASDTDNWRQWYKDKLVNAKRNAETKPSTLEELKDKMDSEEFMKGHKLMRQLKYDVVDSQEPEIRRMNAKNEFSPSKDIAELIKGTEPGMLRDAMIEYMMARGGEKPKRAVSRYLAQPNLEKGAVDNKGRRRIFKESNPMYDEELARDPEIKKYYRKAMDADGWIVPELSGDDIPQGGIDLKSDARRKESMRRLEERSRNAMNEDITERNERYRPGEERVETSIERRVKAATPGIVDRAESKGLNADKEINKFRDRLVSDERDKSIARGYEVSGGQSRMLLEELEKRKQKLADIEANIEFADPSEYPMMEYDKFILEKEINRLENAIKNNVDEMPDRLEPLEQFEQSADRSLVYDNLDWEDAPVSGKSDRELEEILSGDFAIGRILEEMKYRNANNQRLIQAYEATLPENRYDYSLNKKLKDDAVRKYAELKRRMDSSE